MEGPYTKIRRHPTFCGVGIPEKLKHHISLWFITGESDRIVISTDYLVRPFWARSGVFLVQALLSKIFPPARDYVDRRPDLHTVKFGPTLVRAAMARRRYLSRFARGNPYQF